MSKVLLLFILIAPQLLSAQVLHIERPVFDSHRHFRLGSAQAAEKTFSHHDLTAFVFKNAQEVCRIDNADLSKKLEGLFSPNSRLNETLSYFFPRFSIEQLAGLRILFDTFGDLKTLFRGFYIKPSSDRGGTISIDCSAGTLTQLPSVLGHELAHHLNAKKNLAPWIDEMLAQLIEIRIRNSFPAAPYFALSTQADLPSFFARETTFQSSAQYSVNSLFGFWFAQNFGGWEILSQIPAHTRSLSAFADSARMSPLQKPNLKELLTAPTLIRDFAIAMNLNQVPGWQGFSYMSFIRKPGRYTIEPGGSLRVDTRWLPDFAKIPSQSPLEAHRVSKTSSAVYLNKVTIPLPEQNLIEEYVLLINTSTSLDTIVELR